MKNKYDFAIVGGGLAGLTAALHLSRNGYKVILFEKNSYPHHKVCGEYISNEVLPYLKSLGIKPFQLHAKQIHKLVLTNHNGTKAQTNLQLGGFGISRYCLDHHLFEKVQQIAEIAKETITDVLFQETHFILETLSKKQIEATKVIGAFGKRSNLDKALNRSFIQKKTPWLAVKVHYKASFPDDFVALHHFKGGYAGLSKVETNHVNCCYLVTHRVFAKYKNIEEFQEQVMCVNPHLEAFFKTATPVFEKPLTISQISFERKKPVENHLFMIGDSASLIHPLCGNGMAMAIKSAKILAETCIENKNATQAELEKIYASKWEKEFSDRLQAGAFLQKLVMNPSLLKTGVWLNKYNKKLMPYLISKTHGQPF
ncbi:MAG: NAD(P)/FAD-dependent oxidoreductase [Flavobacteriaceae bacterium]|nr:NAD(P)/FAD-dependent oxidoreductase [Flavobacteriaceae bacterium]